MRLSESAANELHYYDGRDYDGCHHESVFYDSNFGLIMHVTREQSTHITLHHDDAYVASDTAGSTKCQNMIVSVLTKLIDLDQIASWTLAQFKEITPLDWLLP